MEFGRPLTLRSVEKTKFLCFKLNLVLQTSLISAVVIGGYPWLILVIYDEGDEFLNFIIFTYCVIEALIVMRLHI